MLFGKRMTPIIRASEVWEAEKRLRSTTVATNATEATATVVALIQQAASTLLKV